MQVFEMATVSQQINQAARIDHARSIIERAAIAIEEGLPLLEEERETLLKYARKGIDAA